MSEKRVKLYIDLTGIIGSRINTGIQRVVKEFIQRTLLQSPSFQLPIHESTTHNDQEQLEAENIEYCYLQYQQLKKKYYQISSQELGDFLKDIQDYKFTSAKEIDIFAPVKEHEIPIFFEMDSVWNIHPKRIHLYPKLKKHHFTIVNYLYDLSPILLPQFAHENTCRSFVSFMSAVYAYSDMLYFDSASAEKDFISIKEQLNVTREIPTRVTGLGSDFTQPAAENKSKVIELENYQQKLFDNKYLLFVGTIEPRKNQEIVLDAFDVLAEKYPDLNLVFIGKQGWKMEPFMERMDKHPLKHKQFFYLNNINDEVLDLFYQHAWMVIYLSKHEGYGLPIAESLRHNNITVSSKNTSMYEVGKNFSDYIVYNSQNEIIDTVSLYYDEPALYHAKKDHIKTNFKSVTWDEVSHSIIQTFDHFPKALKIKNELEGSYSNKKVIKNNNAQEEAIKTQKNQKLQFVFISIDLENLKETIQSIDKYVDFVKEYLIITSAKQIEHFASITSKYTINIIDETTILKEYASDFSQRDHQRKNWLLRASLLNLSQLDDEFIMLDDDNRPLKQISIEHFISENGRYNAYYFYDLLNWHAAQSDFDKGQQNTQEQLSLKHYELLSYASHAPQIINKNLFQEVVDEFFQIGLETSIDEWATYFNTVISKYPYLFNKKPFETLNWPALPTDWKYQYEPKQYTFENHYAAIYAQENQETSEANYFSPQHSLQEKLNIKEKQIYPHRETYKLFDQYQHYLAEDNLIYGCVKFQTEVLDCYLFSVPQKLLTLSSSQFRLTMNCKVINKLKQAQDITVYYSHEGIEQESVTILLSEKEYQESIIELPISTYGMSKKTYQFLIDLKINSKPVYSTQSPYNFSVENSLRLNQVKLPKQKFKTEKIKVKRNVKAEIKQTILEVKHTIKYMPYIGKLINKSYQMIRKIK